MSSMGGKTIKSGQQWQCGRGLGLRYGHCGIHNLVLGLETSHLSKLLACAEEDVL